MKMVTRFAVMAAVLAVLEIYAAEDAIPVARWSFEEVSKGTVPVAGVDGRALKFEGGLVTVQSSPSLQFADASFSITAWVNPYELGGGQQMIVAKNVYSAGKREWGLMLDKDNRFRFYLSQKGWKTVASQTEPRAGHWHHVAVTVEEGRGRLYVNGKQEAEGRLASSVPVTDAPLTIGGVQDGGHVTQTFHGALDEVELFRGVLTPAAIAAMADKQTTPHKIEVIEPVKIWSGGEVPKSDDVPLLKGVEFHVIKKQRPDTDGCRWTLGVGLAWHKDKLYASYGFNKGSENTPTEEAHVRVSGDGGKTWGEPVVMDHGEGNLGVSHGVFLSYKDKLWAFMGAFYDKFQRTHTRAYTLNETTDAWAPHGVVIDAGFWPMQEPQKMADGNWIMAGARVDRGDGDQRALPAVAISRGDDFTRWELVVIPATAGLGRIWGESTVIVEGKRIINISRYGAKALALVSFSEDYGRTWTPSSPSNLPMATSKPYAGTLSTGQRFLVCTTTAGTGGRRSPLTIAVSKPGKSTFSKVFLIRTSVFDGTPGVSDARADFSYPYAVEHAGKLYVGYTHKSHAANELAVIPLSALQEPKPVEIWGGGAVPKSAEIPVLKGTEFHVIKRYEFDKDGYRFLHGVALAWHQGKLYASFGHNKGGENTDTEEARFCASGDGGKTWSAVATMDAGVEPGVGISHGVFLPHKGRLWAFHGAYTGTMQNVHTRAYVLDESSGKWERKGTVIKGGFWALEKPVKMDDGNWIMSGISARGDAAAGGKHPAAVAISHGDDFTKWDLVVIPTGDGVGKMWGESGVIVAGKRITNIARYGDHAQALVAMSDDFGRTWTPSLPSNLPMAMSKPCTGTLSNGQRYLICSTSADGGKRRAPLTIAVSKPGDTKFSKVFVIRHAEFPASPGESHPKVALAYPCATEHDGKLYVGYSNSGGGVDRKGTGRELWNNNSAEMAVIPLDALKVN